MIFSYEINEELLVEIWPNSDKEGAPLIAQEASPDGKPWGDLAEATAWAESFIENFDKTPESEPEPTPEETPVEETPVEEAPVEETPNA